MTSSHTKATQRRAMNHRSLAHAVVVGYDGSLASTSALEWAAVDAQLGAGRLHVICVREPRQASANEPVPPTTLPAGPPLEHMVTRARTIAPDLTVTHEVAEGPTALVLLQASDEADTLVVGAHGSRHRTLADLGSTAWQVASHARCPVVVVRDGPGRDDHRPSSSESTDPRPASRPCPTRSTRPAVEPCRWSPSMAGILRLPRPTTL